MFFAGVDWADDHHDVAVVDESGRLVGSTRVPHSPAGLAELRAFLLVIAGVAAEIPCFVETNHGLLVSSLLEAGFPVYPVNPKTVDRHRKASGAKTDVLTPIFWPARAEATWLTSAGSSRTAPSSRNSRR
jgi:transposase